MRRTLSQISSSKRTGKLLRPPSSPVCIRRFCASCSLINLSLLANARYKRESYRGSEFAPKILAENGIRVVMKVGS